MLVKWTYSSSILFGSNPCVFNNASLQKIEDTFFIVWSPQGTTPPRKTHKDYQEALKVAENMAIKYPNKTFYVMEASAHATVPTPKAEVVEYKK